MYCPLLPAVERLHLAPAFTSICPNDICGHQLLTPRSGCGAASPDRRGNVLAWGSAIHSAASFIPQPACCVAPLPVSSDSRKPGLCSLCLPTPRFTDRCVSPFCCLAVYRTGTQMNSRKQRMDCRLAHIAVHSLMLHSELSHPG